MDKDQLYLSQVRQFGQTIIDFTAEVTYKDFLADQKLQLAVLKLIENIGEAAKRLSEATKAKFPKVDWPKVIADYMDVDMEIVYDVATNEVPALLAAIKEK